MKNLLIVFALIALVSCAKKHVDPNPPFTALRIFIYHSDSTMAYGNIAVWRNEQHLKDYMTNGKFNDLGYYISPTPPLHKGVAPLYLQYLAAGTYYIEATARSTNFRSYNYTAAPGDANFKIYEEKR